MLLDDTDDGPVADQIDRACLIEQANTREREAHYRRLAAPEQTRDKDGNWETTECVSCGEDIEEGRLDLGKVRCFQCQVRYEGLRKQYR